MASPAAQALPTPHSPPRPAVPSGRLAVWWFLGSEVVTFGGLLVAYSLMRLRHPEWGEQAANTLMWAGTLNTVVLLTSSLTMVLAHVAAEAGDHRKAARRLAITTLLGLAFVGVKAFEYSHEIHAGFTPVAGLFWSFYFVMTGLHALHVLGGLVANFIVWLGVRKGKALQRVELVGLYWHFVDVVWIFLFPLLYVAS